MFTTEKRREGTIVFLLRHQRQYPLLTTPERTDRLMFPRGGLLFSFSYF